MSTGNSSARLVIRGNFCATELNELPDHGRLRRLGQREPDEGGGLFSRLRAELDAPAVRLHDPLGDRESEPATLRFREAKAPAHAVASPPQSEAAARRARDHFPDE